ncbi:MAG TPA: rhomboid family intramembrane serine protease [Candidatus Methylacidiphilales bacterium]|jgi:membrane associated rhomboid family serine protease|nr:rhomboid family intramembrane serine protease [Candidatus Methylacidiphilales bacterium]
MFNRDQSDDYRPLFWVSGHPIYVNRLLLILNIAAFAIVAIAVAVLGPDVLAALSLSNWDIVHGGQIWRLVTYVIFPPDTWSAINFIFAMGFLYFFGKQVEEYVGRTAFLYLYAALVLIPSLVATLLAFAGIPINTLGSYGPIFGVFIAFATLYPRMEINIWFVNLYAMYWAFALLGVLTLVDLRDPVGLGALWLDAGIGYLSMRLIGAGYGMTWLTDWIEERRAARLAKKHNIRVMKETKQSESIDEILEKISKQGVGSLTAKERAALERARTKLLKRDER